MLTCAEMVPQMALYYAHVISSPPMNSKWWWFFNCNGLA